MHNSARSRDNLRSPLNTKCNTGLIAASAHILNNPPRKQYFAWQEVKKTLSPKKSLIFPIENGQQQIYLFLFEYSRRPSWFLFPHNTPPPVIKVPPPPLPTHLNINWRLTYQCQYVFLSRADIRMQSSLLWAAEKGKKGRGANPPDMTQHVLAFVGFSIPLNHYYWAAPLTTFTLTNRPCQCSFMYVQPIPIKWIESRQT